MPWILDTDHLSILQQRTRPAFDVLAARLSRLAPAEIFVTISTLLSRNLRDFRRVPGLLVEDWTC